jgi:hypothetical protein
MDAEAQSDPCEETIDPFVKTQFKPLTRYEHVTYTATSDSTVKTLVLGKDMSSLTHQLKVCLNLQNLSGHNKTKNCSLAKSMQCICLYTRSYYISLKICQITYRSLCIIKTSVNGNMPSGHRLLSFWYAHLTDCHRRRDTHN